MKILLIGATGLIGSSILAKLLAQGHSVAAVARPDEWRIRYPAVCWVALDLRNMDAESWTPLLKDIDLAVNCAGVTEDAPDDDVEAAHLMVSATLFKACVATNVSRVIHFSALGADRETPGAFSRDKTATDAELKSLDLDWIILRPSIVVGRRVYGGSALFRGLAALPFIPRFADAGDVLVVQLDDVVQTVIALARAEAPSKIELDLVGPDRYSLNGIVAAYRKWLGARPARQIALPEPILTAIYRLGDYVARLGWRTPRQLAAQQKIGRGAIDDGARWTEATDIEAQSLEAALAAEPADVRDRWFARIYLLKPVIFAVTSFFWISTALISLGPGWDIGVGLLYEGGLSGPIVPLLTISGALSDLAVGVAIAFRSTSRLALIAAFFLSIVYVVLGTILVPRLWRDPVSPMLKIWSVMVLNLVALAIVEDR